VNDMNPTLATILAVVGILPVIIALGALIWRVATLSAELSSKVAQLTEAKVDVLRLTALETARTMNEHAIATQNDRLRNLERTFESQFPRQLRPSRPDIER